MISEVNPSELVKCSSENICLVTKVFLKRLATSCVRSVINIKIDVNLQDIIQKCLRYLQMFLLLHLTSSMGFTSLITAILLHYCFIPILFNNTADLIL